MKCPLCDVDLHLSERQGIEIDYCPKCRGVWLDRGELDKLIERAQSLSSRHGHHEEIEERYAHEVPPRHYNEPHSHHHGHYKHKRRSFLEDIFDFG